MQVQELSDCANCGAVLASDARFCQRCGAPVARMFEPDEPEPAQPSVDIPPLVRVWAPRVAAGLLVLVAGAVGAFALLALLFGVFVE